MNPQALKAHILEHDGTQKKLAESMGISLSCLNAKINGTNGADFRQSEIQFIKNRYSLNDAEINKIFFTRKVS